jgi:hypothetical protein
VVDLPFFSDFVDGMRQILVQDSMGMSPGRRATTTCALLRAAGLFIDSQNLVGDGVFLDRLVFPSGVRLGGAGVGHRLLASVVAGNPRDRSVFLDLLRFFLQNFQDNHFIPICLLVSLYVASCNLIFN